LQQGVEVARPGRAAVHRGEHLHVADRVEPELGRDAAGDDVHHELGGLLCRVQAGLFRRVTGEPVEVGKPGHLRGLAVVDAVGVDDDARPLGLAEDLGQPHPRHAGGCEQVAEDFPGADRGELVDVADQQQVRALWDGLDQLVGQDDVHHRGLIHHDQIGIQGMVTVVFGVTAGLQLQQPVHGGGLVAGQLRQPLGGPAGRCDEHHPGVLGRGESDDGADGETLAAARAAGEHRDLAGQRELDRLLLPWGQVQASPCVQPAQRRGPVHPGERGQPLVAGVQQAQQPIGKRALGPVERQQVYRRNRPGLGITGGWHRFTHSAFGGHQIIQARADQLLAHFQDLGRLADQVRLGQVAVPAVVGGL